MAQESIRPWVGEHYHYNETKLLLLGKRGDPTEMVKKVLDDFEGAKSFMKRLSRGLAGEEEPSKERLRHVWHRVAFTNYVGETKSDFCSNILNKLRPLRIIVLGKDIWFRMPKEHVYMTDDVQGYFLDDHSVAVCWALPSKGKGSGWTQLAEIIYFTMGELPYRYPGDGE